LNPNIVPAYADPPLEAWLGKIFFCLYLEAVLFIYEASAFQINRSNKERLL